MTDPQVPDTPHTMMTVADVATELGCGRDTVYALLASGALRSVRIGERLRRIRRDDLLAYIDSLPTEPVTRPFDRLR